MYEQARRLDAVLANGGRRKILIGTFFGPTPDSADKAHEARSGWRTHSLGLICEYLRCPSDDCEGDMVWRNADRSAGRERLYCLECGQAIESDEIILTRRYEGSRSEPGHLVHHYRDVEPADRR